jgi:NADPH:quinone reductase
MKEYILYKYGDVSNLKLEKIPGDLVPKKDEVVIRHTAIGVNHCDIHFRKGEYTIDKIPAILGLEACGVIEKLGTNIFNYKVGDRVAYATGGLGAYCEKRIINKFLLIKLPSDISDVVVAGSLRKGLMAHTLLQRAYLAQRSKRILVHGAAGGVGQFLCSWARHLGIEVIGTVGHDKKIPYAKEFGCSHVINYKRDDFVKEISNITKKQGVGVVYDGIGKDTLLKSLYCLKPMGICLAYGEVSGVVPPLDINHLLGNSLYLTKPTLMMYKANRAELALSANLLFEKIQKGIIKPKIITHKFEDLRKVHKKMQSRQTVGSQVLVFNK